MACKSVQGDRVMHRAQRALPGYGSKEVLRNHEEIGLMARA